MKILQVQKNYIYLSTTKQTKPKTTCSSISFGDVENSNNYIELKIDKSDYHHHVSGTSSGQPVNININRSTFSGELNGDKFEFIGNEAYGGFRKSYEGSIDKKKFNIRYANPWGTSTLEGSVEGLPVVLDIKFRAERNRINGNFGNHTIDLSMISCKQGHKIEGTIDKKKVDLTVTRNRLSGEYDMNNGIFPFIYALYNDRLMQEYKF